MPEGSNIEEALMIRLNDIYVNGGDDNMDIEGNMDDDGISLRKITVEESSIQQKGNILTRNNQSILFVTTVTFGLFVVAEIIGALVRF